MKKLITLAAYGALAYVVYELVQGWRHPEEHEMTGIAPEGGTATFQEREFARDMEKPDEGRMGRLTGGGRGQSEISSDPSGLAASHITGRGIV